MAELYSVRMRAAQGGPHEKGGPPYFWAETHCEVRSK